MLYVDKLGSYSTQKSMKIDAGDFDFKLIYSFVLTICLFCDDYSY